MRARGRFVAAEISVAGRIRQGDSDGVFGFLKKSPEKAATAVAVVVWRGKLGNRN